MILCTVGLGGAEVLHALQLPGAVSTAGPWTVLRVASLQEHAGVDLLHVPSVLDRAQ